MVCFQKQRLLDVWLPSPGDTAEVNKTESLAIKFECGSI